MTDDIDRRTIRTILDDFVLPAVLSDEYRFSPSGKYVSLPGMGVEWGGYGVLLGGVMGNCERHVDLWEGFRRMVT